MSPRTWTLLAAIALTSFATVAPAAAPTPMQLWRLDCGVIQEDDLNLFSDTYAYVGQSRQLTASCYLIKHGERYMLWDTGVSTDALGRPLQGQGATGESLSKSLPS